MTYKVIRDHARSPIGGHCYGPSNIRGDSVHEVLEKMAAYRAANALPLGDPEQDLAEDYMNRAPWLVKRCEDRPKLFEQKLAETTMSIYRSYPKTLDGADPTVTKRLNVCATCPHACNAIMPPSLYGTAADNRAALFTGSINFRTFKACDHHKWFNAMGARLTHPLIAALLPAPKNCWVQPQPQ